MTKATTTKATTTTTATSPRLGQKLRVLRRREGLTQQQLAERLKISPAYLNLIENGKRPLPAHVLIALAQLFHLDLKAFAEDDDAQLGSDLMEVFGDPLFDATELVSQDIKELANTQPAVARAVISLYRAFTARKGGGAGGSNEGGPEQTSVPSEDVSDFLQRHMNYFPAIEELAEKVRRDARADEDLGRGLNNYLEDRLGVVVEVARASADPATLRRYDPVQKRLIVSELLPPRSRNFQLAHQIGLLTGSDLFDQLVNDPLLHSADSRALARVALANDFAGSVLFPYMPFLEAAEQSRYDIELLGHRFRTSFEQVCHRLTTLRRPGAVGVPFHFLRVDIAGNISKRFSGSGIRFARFAGACPRWNVFSAFLTPGMIKTQVSEFPDKKRYFCISCTIRKVSQGYTQRHALHAVGLGCDLEYAKRLVYADGVDLGHVIPVGVTCRLCERDDCSERAFPAQKAPLVVDENVRASSFYRSHLPVVR
ncbi:MAG: short-chain fatty acyl-CoA regulator family protein [Deltaproteobacteria bacterium]|nr:short-chain fatty acyl-CoA regulator family protein [Deltaproteobacteria bacterium]